MREILFKAKRIDNGEWVEGWIVPTMHNTYRNGYRIIDVRGINYDELDGWEPTFISWEVDKDTLCQYTGLTNKNGNKIWENDVVECQSIIGRIGWNETHMAYTILASVDGNMQYYYIDESLSSDIEVIGNIFDNPELFKERD